MPRSSQKQCIGRIKSKRANVWYTVNSGNWIVTFEDGENWPYEPHSFKVWYMPADPVKKETHGLHFLEDSEKALSLAENGEFEEALEYIDKVIKVCPWDQAFFQKGNICEMMGEYDEAIKYYDKAVEVTPGFDWPMERKAAILRKTGRIWELKEFYNKCVDEKPKIRQLARELEAAKIEKGYDTEYATEEYKMEQYEETLETIRKYIPETQRENIIYPGFSDYSESGGKNVIHLGCSGYSESGGKNVIHLGCSGYSEITEKTYHKSPEQRQLSKKVILDMCIIPCICLAQLLAIYLYMTSSPAGTSVATWITIGVVWSLWKRMD